MPRPPAVFQGTPAVATSDARERTGAQADRGGLLVEPHGIADGGRSPREAQVADGAGIADAFLPGGGQRVGYHVLGEDVALAGGVELQRCAEDAFIGRQLRAMSNLTSEFWVGPMSMRPPVPRFE